MSDIVEGILHTLQGFIETAFAVAHTGWDVAYTFVHGLVMLLWNTLESFAAFIGASVNFVLTNLVVLILITVGFLVYRSSQPSTASAVRQNKGKKRAA